MFYLPNKDHETGKAGCQGGYKTTYNVACKPQFSFMNQVSDVQILL